MDDLLTRAREMLATTPTRWLSLTAVSRDLLALPPLPGEWSALECLQHVVDTERAVFPVRIRALLTGEPLADFNPDLPGMKPEPQQDARTLAEEFARRRVASLEVLAGVTQADLLRSVQHEELGVVTLGELIHEWVAHDVMHLVQAERALMQPFIGGAGPWRQFFAEHTAGEES